MKTKRTSQIIYEGRIPFYAKIECPDGAVKAYEINGIPKNGRVVGVIKNKNQNFIVINKEDKITKITKKEYLARLI